MPLIYIPEQRTFFWHAANTTDRAPYLTQLIGEATPTSMRLYQHTGPAQSLDGLSYPWAAMFWHLIEADDVTSFDDSLRLWHACSRFVLDLLLRGRVLAGIATVEGESGEVLRACWQAGLQDDADAAYLGALAKAMPLAVLKPGSEGDVFYDVEDRYRCAAQLLHQYCNDTMDALMRQMLEGKTTPEASVQPSKSPSRKAGSVWELLWHEALHSPKQLALTTAAQARKSWRTVQRWNAPQAGANGLWRLCLQVSVPKEPGAPFLGQLTLRAHYDPSRQLPLNKKAKELLNGQGPYLVNDGLETALYAAQGIFEPLSRTKGNKPVTLSADEVEFLLRGGARALRQAGYLVELPAALIALGTTPLQLRLQVGEQDGLAAGDGSNRPALALEELVKCSWQALLGEQAVTIEELEALVAQAGSLVAYRGTWMVVDRNLLTSVHKRLQRAPATMSVHQAYRAVLSGELQHGDTQVKTFAAGAVADAIERHRQDLDKDASAPLGLRAILRPYQRRGLAWLDAMSRIGLGSCLADDMGLGKTVQMLALLLQHRLRVPQDLRPMLLVAPTSVLSNWANQAAAFTPTLRIRQHYGVARSRSAAELGALDGAVVLTSYGTLRQDVAIMAKVPWYAAVLDEAQYIKNASSGVARAARSLTALHRFALTGTPLENRLQELWSILQFTNPGLLGSQAYFQRTFANPIEKQRDPEATARLRRVMRPFILRRLKTDAGVAQDLPPKLEMDVHCRLTQEQAVLYRAAVDQHLNSIADSSGLARRGRIFSLLTHLKQICNHPAHFLGEAGPLAQRSGKLLRLTELLAEVLAEDDKALIFTQYKEMGTLLVAHIEQELGIKPMFLHGGTSRAQRDAYVKRFQETDGKPGIFLLSLKAGGTGLNLTAASHVFHYDRWWNPAVEDQATDRAHRIGQRRCLQVHKMICSGTVEEKLDQILRQKRALSKMFVGTSEDWITDLDDAALRDLFSLSAEANDWVDSEEHSLGC